MSNLTRDIPRLRRFRAGMIGGGQGSFFGGVHRAAMRLSNRFDIVAGVFSSDAATSALSAESLGVAPERNYRTFQEMVTAERNRHDPVEVVIVVTPNHLHFEPCKLFLEAGIPVICDKPLVNSSEDARTLQRIAETQSVLFAVTYTYTGYPMVRDARARVRAGEIGDIKFVYVEYLLEWLANDPQRLGKGAIWRGDPAKAGPTGVMGDIGTHAFNIAEFVSGQRCNSLSAKLLRTTGTFGLDDTDIVQMEFDRGAHGLLWVSLAAPGHRNGLRFKIVGSKATIDWQQEAPETLRVSGLGKADMIYRRGNSDLTPDAQSATSLPAGNPEAYLEALANLYSDYARALEAGSDWREANPVPIGGLYDGLRGVLLSELSVKSSASRQWVDFPDV